MRIVFLGPLTSAAMLCSCNPFTTVCCHHRRPKESNIHVL